MTNERHLARATFDGAIVAMPVVPVGSFTRATIRKRRVRTQHYSCGMWLEVATAATVSFRALLSDRGWEMVA